MKPSSRDIAALKELEKEIGRAKDANKESISFLRDCLACAAATAPLDDLIVMSEHLADFLRRNISRGVLLDTDE